MGQSFTCLWGGGGRRWGGGGGQGGGGGLCSGVELWTFPVSAVNGSLAHSGYTAKKVRERVNERQKMEMDSSSLTVFWALRCPKSFCHVLPQNKITYSQSRIYLPQTPNTHTYLQGVTSKKIHGKNSTGAKKKKKTTFSVSWISKIFIWSLRFMAGPGNLVGSAQ